MKSETPLCPNCRTLIEEGYDMCWHCNYSIPDGKVLIFQDVDPQEFRLKEESPPRPRGWIGGSVWLTLIFFPWLNIFSLLLGINCIILSRKVDRLYHSGDFSGAIKASEEAALFIIACSLLWFLLWLIRVLILIL